MVIKMPDSNMKSNQSLQENKCKKWSQIFPDITLKLFFSEGGGGTADLAVFGGGSCTLPQNLPGEVDEQGQTGE